MNTALQRLTQAILVNKSGGDVVQGDVVVIDLTTPSSFTTTTTVGFVNGIVGVVLEPNGIANNAQGMIALGGPVPKVNLSGSASLGDLFKTHSVAKQAERHAAGVAAGDFGIVLGTGTAPAALLWGLPAGATGAGSGDFVGPASATDGNLVLFNGTTGKLGKDGGAVPTPGLALISEQTPNGTGTVAFLNIPGTYQTLILDFVARGTQAAELVLLNLKLNTDATDANYRRMEHEVYGTNTSFVEGGDDRQVGVISSGNAPTNSASVGRITIPFYAKTTFNKQVYSTVTSRRNATSEDSARFGVEWENAVAITQIDLVLSAGNYVSGSTFRLYGQN